MESHLLLRSGVVQDTWAALGSMVGACRRLVRDTRGAVTSEYVILVGTVGLVVAGAFIAIGPQLVAGYQHARDVLAAPFP